MSTATLEEAIWIECAGARMLGIAATPAPRVPRRRAAVLIAVGGPQYHVGSHRQFTLLARRLAASGYASLRFDFRGMGDSDGDMRSFEEVGEDFLAALSALHDKTDANLPIVIWGLCDAASAALMFCAEDPRIAGMVLANPWARGDASYAQATLKHYYGAQLASGVFWQRLLSGKIDLLRAARDFSLNLRKASVSEPRPEDSGSTDFRATMARGLNAFRGSVLLMLSSNDLTAREFLTHAESDPLWRGLLDRPCVQRVSHPVADHTFSTAEWRTWAEDRTLEWLDSLVP